MVSIEASIISTLPFASQKSCCPGSGFLRTYLYPSEAQKFWQSSTVMELLVKESPLRKRLDGLST